MLSLVHTPELGNLVGQNGMNLTSSTCCTVIVSADRSRRRHHRARTAANTSSTGVAPTDVLRVRSFIKSASFLVTLPRRTHSAHQHGSAVGVSTAYFVSMSAIAGIRSLTLHSMLPRSPRAVVCATVCERPQHNNRPAPKTLEKISHTRSPGEKGSACQGEGWRVRGTARSVKGNTPTKRPSSTNHTPPTEFADAGARVCVVCNSPPKEASQIQTRRCGPEHSSTTS